MSRSSMSHSAESSLVSWIFVPLPEFDNLHVSLPEGEIDTVLEAPVHATHFFHSR